MKRVIPQNSILSEKEIFGGGLKDFKILCELGRGSYGTVYKAESLLNNRECVLKKIDINNLKEKHRKNAVKEVEILKKVRHENIIKYFNSFLEDSSLYIVMEYAAGGDLQKQISHKKNMKQPFTEEEIWDYAYQIAQALIYLHSHKIIHRDIKALNIFLDKNNKIKLGDLGVSKIVANQVAINGTRVGTPLYLAPELVKHQPYDNKIDIWAFGCVVYFLAALEPPFTGENLISLGYNIVNRIPKSLPMNYSENLSSFVMTLLEKNNEKRKSLKEILEYFPNTINKIENNNEKKQTTPTSLFKQNIELKSPVKIVTKNEFDNEDWKKPPENFSKPEIISSIGVLHEKTHNDFLVEFNQPKIDNFVAAKIEKDEIKSFQKDQRKEIEKAKNSPQKFKIRPCSANIMISNKVKEKNPNPLQTPTTNTNINEKMDFKSPINIPEKIPKQNTLLFRPKSAIVPKQNAVIKGPNPILSSRLVNNFGENDMKKEIKESNITLTCEDNKRVQEKIIPKEKLGNVCPEIKDMLAFPSSNGLHSCFYENNKNNNLNSNFFFQIFGVQKPIFEKNTKFQINNLTDNASTIQIANTYKKKEDLSETTQRTAHPKIIVNKRDEILNRKGKAISSFTFFQQFSKPAVIIEKLIPQNGDSQKALNNILHQNKAKKKFYLKDLIDE